MQGIFVDTTFIPLSEITSVTLDMNTSSQYFTVYQNQIYHRLSNGNFTFTFVTIDSSVEINPQSPEYNYLRNLPLYGYLYYNIVPVIVTKTGSKQLPPIFEGYDSVDIETVTITPPPEFTDREKKLQEIVDNLFSNIQTYPKDKSCQQLQLKYT